MNIRHTAYSLRITSQGLVKAAPATPEITDLIELRMTLSLSVSAAGRFSSRKSLTTIAVTYFGTVLIIPEGTIPTIITVQLQ